MSKKRGDKTELPATYIFPDFLAQWMSKVDQRTQYEASMLSMSLLIMGLVLSTVYSWIYTDLAIWFKITISVNAFFGMVFMWSFIVTTYQQYLSYMEAKQLATLMEQAVPDVSVATAEEKQLLEQYLPDSNTSNLKSISDERRLKNDAKKNN